MDKRLGPLLEIYRTDPLAFVEDVFAAKPTEQQKQVLIALREGHKHIAVKSGHGTGKTCLQAWIILWYMLTRPHCKIPCTAPTQSQLFDVLWSEIQKWINEIRFPDLKEFFEWTSTHVYSRNNPHTWFAVARSSTKPENMQGFHADNLMFIIDEASGVDQNLMEVIQGALTNEGAMCLMFGNPTQVSGMFFEAFHKDARQWTTFTFSCLDSSNVSQDYIDRFERKYGKDSNAYRVRVLGEFPTEGDDAIIPLSYAEQAVLNDISRDEKAPIYVGVDVARYGDDKTVIVVRQGNKVLSMKEYTKQSTMETAGRVFLMIKDYAARNRVCVNVDDTGVGGGVTDRLLELTSDAKNIAINGVNNGERPSSVGDAGERYMNLGAQLWFYMRENIREWDIPDDEELIVQLSTRKYKIHNAKLQLERKEDMKKRGVQSPDKADALALAFYDEAEDGVVILW